MLVLYYVANIVYDLYFKKAALIGGDNSEVISMNNMYSDDVSVQNVTIDDVEVMSTPNSFVHKLEDELAKPNELSEEERLNKMREDFENENELEGQPDVAEAENDSKNEEGKEDDDQHSDNVRRNLSPEEKFQKSQKITDIDFQKIMLDAETEVYVSSKVEGYTTYKIAS